MESFDRFARTEAIRANLKQRSVRGAAFTAAGQGLDFVLRLVAIAVLARLLTPESFGLVAMVTALTGILEGVKDVGLTTATMQRPELTHPLVSTLFWVNTLAGALIALALAAASPLVAHFYGEPRLADITIALSVMFVWMGVSAQHEALLIRQLRQGDLAIIRVVASLVSFGVAVVLALEGAGYWALVWREVLRTALVAIGAWIRCPWIPGLPSRVAGIGDVLRFGRDLSLTQLLSAAVNNLDRLVIGKFFGAVPLGEYRLAHQTVAATIDQINGPIGSVANPGLSMLHSDPARYRRYFEKVTFLIALMTMPVAVYATLYATELTVVLLGERWTAAAPYFAVFAASAFFRPIHGAQSSVLISRGRSQQFLRMTMANKVVFVACVVVGLDWGPFGIAMAHLVGPAIVFLPNALYAFKGSPVALRGYFRAARTPALASVVLGVCLVTAQSLHSHASNVASIAVGAAVALLVYPAALFLVPGARRDMQLLLADVRVAMPGRTTRQDSRDLES